MADKEFNGVSNLDVRDSVPDGTPFEDARVRELLERFEDLGITVVEMRQLPE